MRNKSLQKTISFAVSSLLITSLNLFANEKENKSKKIDSVTIIAKESSNYLNKDKTSINRSNIELEDMSKSIQLFNQEYIEDAQSQNIEDIIKMSSNTVYTGDTDGKSTNISMRGFSGVPILIDGLKITNKTAHPEVFNFETVEIQKGPDSLQYGTSSPGGIVNLVTKKPIKDFAGKIELEVSDNPSITPKLDVGGSLNEDKSLYFRLLSTLEHNEGWTNSNTDTNKAFIAPSLSYDINDNNTITFVSEYSNEKGPTTFGTNVNSKGDLVAPIENLASHPDEEFEKTQKMIGFDVDSIYSSWNSNFKYRYIKHIRDYGNVYLPLLYNESTNSVTRFPAQQRQEFSENLLQYTLNKEFSLFKFKNNLSVGTDYNKAYSQTTSRVVMDPFVIDLANPDYEDRIVSVDEYSTIRDMSGDKTYVETWGSFIQDNINISENLIMNVGLRYSESKPQDGLKSNALTPSFGLVYKINPTTSIYASYSESFSPNSVTDKDGKILDPEEGIGYEMGIKKKLYNDNMLLTAAIFKIEKENIALSDDTTINTTDYVASGEQSSRGIELDLTGNITDNLSIVASYGYTSTENKQENNLQLRNIPKHTANIFTTYNLSSFNLPNYYIGGGARYIGTRYGDDANTIKFDSEIIYNATIGYKKGNWQASLSIQNLTDEEYVDGSASGTTSDTRVYVGTPRTILAKVSYRF
ncbi:TonB-dependent siderophore receptor [Halarcobacter ebronensis]|uniref:TonB-dependent siderophore receptor n=1 Tax=Halarcobacter ebronensis TaxID=1462615 RepID=A0A4Q1ATN6_9BACT|nr:TonB-dependent receptor [Halarcobacter ebronensis]QKF82439.1 TonB-dependent siderophore receptor [Halarcobacter ebronensis]RXK07540.1 TonB-dependent siderophore receptor [Halarcobacter ebronensis]